MAGEGLNIDLIAERRQTVNEIVIPFGYMGVVLMNNSSPQAIDPGSYPLHRFRISRMGRTSKIIDYIIMRERIVLTFSFDQPFSTADNKDMNISCLLHMKLAAPVIFLDRLMQDRHQVGQSLLENFLLPDVRDAVKAFVIAHRLPDIKSHFDMPKDIRVEFDLRVQEALQTSGWSLERIHDVHIRETILDIPNPIGSKPINFVPNEDVFLTPCESSLLVFRQEPAGLVCHITAIAYTGRLGEVVRWRVDLPARITGTAPCVEGSVAVSQYDGALVKMTSSGEQSAPFFCGIS